MQLVEEVAFGALDQRLANLLVEQGPLLEITHQQIADELGTVREVVSRRLRLLQQQGLVRLKRGQVEVLDLKRLSRPARCRDEPGLPCPRSAPAAIAACCAAFATSGERRRCA